MADEKNLPELPPVAAQKNAQVGDENTADVHKVEVEVNDEALKVHQPSVAEPTTTTPVYEVAVKLDEVITDPNDPRAVQVPDAGRGDALLPIHAFVNARTVEEIFSEEASDESEVSPEDRAKSSASGSTPSSARGSKKS